MDTKPFHAAPINRHKNGHYLLREILNTSWGRHLSGAPNKFQMFHWLLAPFALARSLSLLSPERLPEDTLRVIIGGAGFIDTFDRGGWYQMLPWLLGQPNLKIEVALVGPDAGYADHAASRTGFLPNNFTAAEICHSGTLASFLEQDRSKWDVLMLLNPGLSVYWEWYDDPSILQFLEAGKPVLCASQSKADNIDDLYIAGFHGLGTSRTADNPYSLGSLRREFFGEANSVTEERMKSAEVLWRMERIPPQEHPDLNALRAACERVHHTNTQNQSSESAMIHHANRVRNLGTCFLASQIEGAERLGDQSVVVLYNQCLLLLNSGAVYSVRQQSFLDVARVPPSLIASYPFHISPEASPMPKKVFAELVWETLKVV